MKSDEFPDSTQIITHVRKIDAQGRLNFPETLLSTIGINRNEGLKTGISDNGTLIAMNKSAIESFMEQIERNGESIDEKLREQILFQYEKLLCSDTTELDEKNRIIVPAFMRKILCWEPKTELDLSGSLKKKQLYAKKLKFNLKLK